MITPDQQTAIEPEWLSRAKAQELKPTSAKCRSAEIDFFCGAIAALQALFPNADNPALISKSVPAKWVMAPLTGLPIVNQSKA